MNCPWCGDTDKKFAVNIETGAWNCLHLNTCGLKGSWWKFQEMHGDEPKPLDGSNPFYDIHKPKTYRRPKVQGRKADTPVMAYLKSRGFTDETIKQFRLGSKDKDVLMIPYHKAGELTNVKYRSISDKSKMWQEKDAEPTLFNRDNVHGGQLLICEGEFDCMTLVQYGFEAVSVPSGASNFEWLETEWDYLETFGEILLCLDNDAAGHIATRKLAARIGAYRCSRVVLPKKDANECLTSGISKDVIADCIKNAKPIKPDTLVNPSYYSGKIKELFERGPEQFGTETPWDKLTQILKGWRDAEVTVWSGRNGSGKSTILNQVIISLGLKNIRSCIYSGEMPPERYLRWMVIQTANDAKPTSSQVDEILGWLDNRAYILNMQSGMTPEKLMHDFEYAARRYNVKHFVIDSLMKIKLGGSDKYEDQEDFVNTLSDFAKKFDAHVHLVAHPRKSAADTDEPGKVDVKGSSHITDLADNVLVLYRVDEQTKQKLREKDKTPVDMRLFVKKNREFGNEGIVNMQFDTESKTYSDG